MTGRSRPGGRLRIRRDVSAHPLQAGLGVLGGKWSLLVLMNIASGRARRFDQMLGSTPRMSKRVLAMRLLELEGDGFIAKAEPRRG